MNFRTKHAELSILLRKRQPQLSMQGKNKIAPHYPEHLTHSMNGKQTPKKAEKEQRQNISSTNTTENSEKSSNFL